jgi:hypothetical protein
MGKNSLVEALRPAAIESVRPRRSASGIDRNSCASATFRSMDWAFGMPQQSD